MKIQILDRFEIFYVLLDDLMHEVSCFNSMQYFIYQVLLFFLKKTMRVCVSCCFQAAVYGIGICAEFGGSAFRPHTGGMCCIYGELG